MALKIIYSGLQKERIIYSAREKFLNNLLTVVQIVSWRLNLFLCCDIKNEKAGRGQIRLTTNWDESFFLFYFFSSYSCLLWARTLSKSTLERKKLAELFLTCDELNRLIRNFKKGMKQAHKKAGYNKLASHTAFKVSANIRNHSSDENITSSETVFKLFGGYKCLCRDGLTFFSCSKPTHFFIYQVKFFAHIYTKKNFFL